MKTLKIQLAVVTAAIILGGSVAEATIAFTQTSPNNYSAAGSSLSQVIPDNNYSGVAYALSFGFSGVTIRDISVMLNISGGYNGDIYAYLSHGSEIAYLLAANPAVSGSGFNITFVEGTGSPIPTGGSGVLTGSYNPAIDFATTFNTTDPNGAWTLFLADLSPGDTSTLNSFGVNVTGVPEPVNVALGAFGVLLLAIGGVRRVGRKIGSSGGQ